MHEAEALKSQQQQEAEEIVAGARATAESIMMAARREEVSLRQDLDHLAESRLRLFDDVRATLDACHEWLATVDPRGRRPGPERTVSPESVTNGTRRRRTKPGGLIQAPRPDHSAVAAGARGSGDRVTHGAHPCSMKMASATGVPAIVMSRTHLPIYFLRSSEPEGREVRTTASQVLVPRSNAQTTLPPSAATAASRHRADCSGRSPTPANVRRHSR